MCCWGYCRGNGAFNLEMMVLPDLIPRELLLGLPKVTNPEVSPDGRKIAYLKRTNDVLNIWLKDEKGERQLTFEKGEKHNQLHLGKE